MAGKCLCAWRGFNLLQFVCVLLSFIVVTNSASQEPEERTYNLTDNEIQTTFGTSHGRQRLEVRTAHLNRRRPKYWSSRTTQLSSQAAASGDYVHAWRSIFKNGTDCCDRAIVLVVSTDGTAQFTNIQDTADQVSELNTKQICVTSGIHQEVINPATKPYITLQGEGRNRINISWHETAGSVGISIIASVIESDHFIARDISFRDTTEDPDPNKKSTRAAAIRVTGNKAFLHKCDVFSHQDTLCGHQVGNTTSDALFKAVRTLS